MRNEDRIELASRLAAAYREGVEAGVELADATRDDAAAVREAYDAGFRVALKEAATAARMARERDEDPVKSIAAIHLPDGGDQR